MNILLIPDVHLRKFWRQCISDNISKVDKVVFLGDYFDPYNEPDLEEDPILMINNIIDLKKNEPDKYTLLIGNHDCHYIWDEYPQSTRFSVMNYKNYHNTFLDNLELFNIAFVQDNTIFSHAGITDKWKDLCFPELSTLELGKKLALTKLNDNCVEFGYLAAISFYRGGWSKAGSCEWADIREHYNYNDLTPIKYDCFQIFGHTKIKEPIIEDTWACLDCKKGFIVDTLTYEITEC